jgi:hypothetical protein
LNAPSVDCGAFLRRSLGVLGNQSSVCLWLFKVWQVAGALDDLESGAFDQRGGLAHQFDRRRAVVLADNAKGGDLVDKIKRKSP